MARPLTAREVRALIAEAFASQAGSRSLGQFTLRDDQQDVVTRIEASLQRFGGALLCDPPGSGKTVVALAVAHRRRESRPALVLAPAALREQWLRSAEAAETSIVFSSLESVSRGTPLPPAPLMVVDEAHRLGAEGTARYARIAAYAARTPLLLLTATPVVNRLGDRDRLLGLFLGARSTVESDDVIIRRRRDAAALPHVLRLPPIDAAVDVPELAHALRTLPAPFPVADGRAATALVQTTLAFAWRSSLAALAHSLKRREISGTALFAELSAGRWPDRRTLQRWILGDEPSQLTLGLTLARNEAGPPEHAVSTLEQHLEAVRDMRALIAPHVERDTARRAEALLALVHRRAPARAVCFAHHAETIRALWTALRRTPGVVAITGERVFAAVGHWTREEVLRALGPLSVAWRADDPRGIRLLLTTDLLAEGVELQGTEIVVHGDSAWTPARLEQRVGRSRRPSSRADAIAVTGFRAPLGSSSLLRLAHRLRSKRTARQQALNTAEARERMLSILARWRCATAGTSPRDEPLAPVVATITHERHALLALVEQSREPRLLAARRESSRWRIVTDPRELLPIIASASAPDLATDESFARVAVGVIDRWLARRDATATVGTARAETSVAMRALRRRLSRTIDRTPLVERRGVALRVQRLISGISNAWTAGIERELRALLRTYATDTELIAAVDRASRDWMDRKQHEPRESARLVALLLFQPAPVTTAAAPHPAPAHADHAPPSASP